jgi:hypothetical protein
MCYETETHVHIHVIVHVHGLVLNQDQVHGGDKNAADGVDGNVQCRSSPGK